MSNDGKISKRKKLPTQIRLNFSQDSPLTVKFHYLLDYYRTPSGKALLIQLINMKYEEIIHEPEPIPKPKKKRN